jgi:hypothetical protein
MKFLIQKLKTWWGGLPWWGKVLASLVWVLIALFFILFLVGKILGGTGDVVSLKKLDKKVEEMFKDQDAVIWEDIEHQEAKVEEAKKTIADKIASAGKIDEKTKEDTDRILAAKTMKELDALQEELGL